MELKEEIKSYPLVRERKKLVSYTFAKQKSLLPLKEEAEEIVCAIPSPCDFASLDELRLILKKKVRPLFFKKEEIEEAIELCYRQKEGEAGRLVTGLLESSGFKKEEEGFDLLEQAFENPVIRALNSILTEAIQQGASDIHFEPKESGLEIRYRIDGALQPRHSPPAEYRAQIIARVKVMANLDIAEQRLPQDGRIKLKFGKREIDFRVSTIPVVYGERVVLRILDKGNIILGLDKLGMSEEVLKKFRFLISLPEGIVLVTGPTGSGKTTTLYSAIAEISSFEKNIMTIEDPVEYKLSQIAQMAVNPKINLTFAQGLRHILRQDPDAIMVGEIRDSETAAVAIQSALTGHLVLSTLHTNDAPSAITRLADMGVEPYLISSSVLGILAQRLVRKICPDCKEPYFPPLGELKLLKLEKEKERLFYRGKGCPACFNTGYRGRHGIYELLVVNSKLRSEIIKGVDSTSLRKIAIGEGMNELLTSGAELVLSGVTTSAEVLRVVNVFRD